MSWDVGDLDSRDQLRHTLPAECLYRSFSWSGSSSVLDERTTVRGNSSQLPGAEHTNHSLPHLIPAPAQHVIVQQQTRINVTESPTERVASMSPSIGSPSAVLIPNGVSITPTGILPSDIPGSTTRTRLR